MSGESGYLRWAVSPTRLIGRLSTAIPDRGDPTWYVLALSMALFVGFSLYMSVLYQGFALGGADFGSYIHMFATTLAGEGWLQQGKYIASHPGGSYWGGHFTVTLLAFLPLYALVPSPYTLIVAKAFTLAASIPLLWVLARDRLDSDRLAGWVTASYALNPFLWSAWLFHFQEQVLLPLFVFGAYYTYTERRSLAFLGLFALALLTNEFVVIIAVGFLLGLFVAAYRESRLRADLPLLVGAAALTVGVRLLATRVVAAFSAFSGLPPASIAPPFRPYVEGVRGSIVELIAISLANPEVLIETLSLGLFEKVAFLLLLTAPVLFLPLTDEITLGALAPYLAFAWVFAGRDVYYTFGAHYPLYVLPFVYIGAVRALGRTDLRGTLAGSIVTEGRLLSIPDRDTLRAVGRSGVGRVLVVVLVVNLIAGAAVVAGQDETDVAPTDADHDDLRREAIGLVPESASLLTQNDLYSHVATRPRATFIPVESTFGYYQQRYGTPTPEYLLFDTTTWWSTPLESVYGDRLGAGYGLVAYEDGIWVLERGYDGPPRGITGAYAVESRRYDASAFIPNDARITGGEVVAEGGRAGTYLWYGPNALLPPGTYTATFRMNVTRGSEKPVAGVDVAAGKTHRTIADTTVPAVEGPQNVTLEFTLDEPRRNVEFRGYRAGGDGTVSLEYVAVSFVSGPTNDSRANASSRSNERYEHRERHERHDGRQSTIDAGRRSTVVGDPGSLLTQADGGHGL